MRPRFQADNDLRSSIRRGVLRREPAVDFATAIDADLDALPDPDVLRLAAIQGRILVTHDANTMTRHFRDFLQAGNHTPGVLMVPQEAAVSRIIESIVLIWVASEASEWADRIVWLPI